LQATVTHDRKITIVTGNSGKLASFRRYLEPHGFTVSNENLDLIEPQLDSIEEVALSKARQAHAILKAPVVVEDTGFYIAAWNDFPGPYNKYFINKIGVDGYLKLMEGKADRSCHFFSAVAYIDENGREHVFTSEIAGTLAEKADDLPLRSDAKSTLWKIFIPSGSDKTLNELDGEERAAFFKALENKSATAIFAKWLDSRDAPARKASRACDHPSR
jgi:XTP/dITP diphosphohydrolase